MPTEATRKPRWIDRVGDSLGARLALVSALPVILILSLAGAALVQAWRTEARLAARESAYAYLHTLAVPCARSLAVHALDRLDLDLTDAMNVGSSTVRMIRVAVLDRDGQLVAQSGAGGYNRDTRSDTFFEAALKDAHGHWRQRRGEDGRLLLDVSAPAVSGLRWGTLIATFDIESAEAAARRSAWVIGGLAALVVLVLSATLAQSLRFLLVDPVDELARAAAEIRRGQFGARAWVVSRDELGRLANDFNAMADELETYTHSLERKVEERAAEVQRKNRELEAVNARLADAVDELERLATQDGLTGVPNRRVFDQALELETQRGARSPHPFCVVMIDVDNFKHYNDTNGHQAGDRALQKVAQVMRDALRTTDLLARYGGEEFVVLLLDTDRAAGLRVAEALRRAIEASHFEHGASQPLGRVSASLGLAAYDADGRGPDELLAHADAALYEAKRRGRNRVVGWDVSLGEGGHEAG